MHIKDFFETVLTTNPKELSDSSISRYRQSCSHFLSIMHETTTLEELDDIKINEFAKRRFESGKSLHTVNLDLRQLQAILRLGAKLDNVDCKHLHLSKLPDLDALVRVFTMEEVQRLASAEPDQAFRDFLLFLVWTGIKKNEALRLRWGDVYSDAQIPYLNVTSSSESTRRVILIDFAADKLGPRKGDNDLAFPLWRPEAVAKRFRNLANRVNLEGRLLNDLTDCVFKWAVDLGIPKNEILHFNNVVLRLYQLIWPEFEAFSKEKKAKEPGWAPKDTDKRPKAPEGKPDNQKKEAQKT
jgi:integrase